MKIASHTCRNAYKQLKISVLFTFVLIHTICILKHLNKKSTVYINTPFFSVSVLLQVEEGWWEGILNGKTGMFPSNFIKELSVDSDDVEIAQEEQLIKPSKEQSIIKSVYFSSSCLLTCWYAGIVLPLAWKSFRMPCSKAGARKRLIGC